MKSFSVASTVLKSLKILKWDAWEKNYKAFWIPHKKKEHAVIKSIVYIATRKRKRKFHGLVFQFDWIYPVPLRSVWLYQYKQGQDNWTL